MNSRQTADKFMLRLPGGMRQELKVRSAMNRRSMNAEIVILLEQALVLVPQATTGAEFGDKPPAVAPNHVAPQGD